MRLATQKEEYIWMGILWSNWNKYQQKMVHFVHAFMIAELLGFASFLLKSMSEISRRTLTDIKLITMDGKFVQESFCEELPGMFHAD